jgi:hypothetical protein
MNRGLSLTTSNADEKELLLTARGIVVDRGMVKRTMEPFLQPIAKAYQTVYEEHQPNQRKDFFGLR